MKKIFFFCEKGIPYLKELCYEWGEWIEFTSISELADLIHQEKLSTSKINDMGYGVVFIKTSTQCNNAWNSLGHLLPKIRIVATPAVGDDHINFTYLKKNNITFLNSPGCNRSAVTDYVLFLSLKYCLQRNKRLNNLTIGIVGLGNIGWRLAEILLGLKVKVHACDPLIDPKSERLIKLSRENFRRFRFSVDIGDILTNQDLDIMTFHVPLHQTSPHPTYHLFSYREIELITSHCLNKPLIINSSRGGVIDELAFIDYLKGVNNRIDYAADVWENEPYINIELARRCFFITPHLAGYTHTAKYRASQMVFHKVWDKLKWQFPDLIRKPLKSPLSFSNRKTYNFIPKTSSLEQNLYSAIEEVTSLKKIGRLFRKKLNQVTSASQVIAFQEMRKSFRNELGDVDFRVLVKSNQEKGLMSISKADCELLEQAFKICSTRSEFDDDSPKPGDRLENII